MSDPIKFYSTKGEHGYMSNFARYKVECFGHVWMTSEHAYQAQKFAGMNEEDYDAVRFAGYAGDAASIGRDPNRKLRPDWDAVKDDVMRFVVFHKFSQNADIREKLLATGDRPLFEYDTKRGDQYWAIDRFGRGKNMLGVVLMETREVLREDASVIKEHKAATEECAACMSEAERCKAHSTLTLPSNLYLTSLKF